jgi:hypothetical protein
VTSWPVPHGRSALAGRPTPSKDALRVKYPGTDYLWGKIREYVQKNELGMLANHVSSFNAGRIAKKGG